MAMVEVRREERDRFAWLAWHTAVLTRMDHKRFPPLEKMLFRKPREQTPDEMKAALMAAFESNRKDA